MSVASEVSLTPRQERAAIAAAVLAQAPSLPAPPAGAVRRVEGKVLHASRSRPVVRWVLADTAGTTTTVQHVVGKVFNKGDGAGAHDLLTHLRRSGFAGAFDVPTSFGYIPERRLLLQSEAPIQTLHVRILDGAASAAADVYRTGQWLARLHAVTGTRLRPLAPDFETHKADHYVRGLSLVKPAMSWQLRDMARRLVPLLSAAGPLVVTHGDFQQKNVHIDDDRVVVIDFDRAALAPAARDLGHFVGQSLTMAAAGGADFDGPARAVALSLIDGYLDAGGCPDAVAAMPAYVARTFLEVLFYRLVVRPMREDTFAAAWVDECSHWLTQAVAEA